MRDGSLCLLIPGESGCTGLTRWPRTGQSNWAAASMAQHSSSVITEDLNSPKKLASMLHREHVCIEIGNPLLALLRYLKVAQCVSDIPGFPR
jgi:hypothetical protein